MPRIARAVAVDFPHHIIQRGNNRQKVFFAQETRIRYLDLLKEYAAKCGAGDTHLGSYPFIYAV